MNKFSDILKICRLCLVEEKVNHAIFEESGDLRSIFLKISSCLPVSVNKDDGLPEKICDTCSTKLDSFYQFWNETANAEKQLLHWLSVNKSLKQNQIADTSKRMETPEVKQEEVDPIDMSSDAQTYILQQQQLPYAAAATDSVNTSESEEPISKRPRRASAVKALEQMESEDEDDPDNYAKSETDESEKDEEEEETNYQENPSTTSVEDQPGPSGLASKKMVLDDTPSRRNHFNENTGSPHEIEEILDSDEENDCESKTEQEDDCLIKLKCPECEERFSYNCEFLYHFKSCHEVSVEVKRPQAKPTPEQNGKHLRDPVGPGEGYGCEFCARRFTTRKGLGKHRSIRHRDKRYTCGVCSQDLPSSLSLEQHMKTHSGIRPYQCFQCGRNFSARKFLAVHERVHSKDKPYTCELCYKSFTQKSTLTVHMRYHSGERPYVCDVCQKGFVTRTLMKKHLRTHGISP